MGAKPNYQVNHHSRYLCLTASGGESAYHKGAQIGAAHSSEVGDADLAKFLASLDTVIAFGKIVEMCRDVRAGSKPLSDLDALMATFTATFTAAPFGGSLASFWASLATHEKVGGTVDGVSHRGFVAAILIAAVDARISS